MEKMRDRAARQVAEHLRRGTRPLIREMYADVCSESADSGLPAPSWTVFYNMPAVAAMRGYFKVPGFKVEKIRAMESFINTIITQFDQEFPSWQDEQLEAFRRLMELQKGRFKLLQPLEYATALFNCSSCFDLALKNSETVSMDFVEACKHDCKKTSKNIKGSWSADQFVVDVKAVRVTRTLLELFNLRENDTSKSALEKMEIAILCESCDGIILLNVKAMQKHCHRHRYMEMSLCAKKPDVVPDVEWGLRDTLVRKSRKSVKLRKKKIFVCRHCLPCDFSWYEKGSRPDGDSQSAEPKYILQEGGEQQAEIPKRTGIKKKFDFDGLQSHVKRRHGIKNISDEDFYRVQP